MKEGAAEAWASLVEEIPDVMFLARPRASHAIRRWPPPGLARILRIFYIRTRAVRMLWSQGVMHTPQFDHGSNRFALDTIERPSSIGDCPIVRRPPCPLEQEPQRIERFPEARARRRNSAMR